MKYDGGTVARPYDQNSQYAVKKYLNNKRDIHYPSIKAMVDSYKGHVKPR